MKQFSNHELPLPTNRFQLLKDIIRYRFFEIVLLSVYVFIFFLPSLIWLIFSSYIFIGNENHTIYEIIFIQGINIIFIMIYGLGVCGALYVAKKISFQEGESINHDFFYGIRKNYKMFLLIYFLIGLSYFLLEVGVSTIDNLTNIDEIGKGAIEGFLYAAFIIFIMIFFFMQTQTILFEASLFQLFRNGLKFTFGMFLKNLGIFALILWPFFIYEFVPNINGISYFQYGVVAFEAIFYFGFSFIVFSLYSNHVFDLTINKNQFPQNIRKGLADENRDISN